MNFAVKKLDLLFWVSILSFLIWGLVMLREEGIGCGKDKEFCSCWWKGKVWNEWG